MSRAWILKLVHWPMIRLINNSAILSDSPCLIYTKEYSVNHPVSCTCVSAQSLQSCLTLFHPMDCSPQGSCVHGVLQQEYWCGLPFPLQGIILTQGLNWHLLHLLNCRQIFYPLSHLGSPSCIWILSKRGFPTYKYLWVSILYQALCLKLCIQKRIRLNTYPEDQSVQWWENRNKRLQSFGMCLFRLSRRNCSISMLKPADYQQFHMFEIDASDICCGLWGQIVINFD